VIARSFLAAVALLPLLALIAAGCQGITSTPVAWPVTCEREGVDTTCATCVKTACCTEALACKSDTRCECYERCYADPPPMISADLFCAKTCRKPSEPFKATRACVDAHCAGVCPGGGGG
jgi:hypothetical protein